MSKAQAKSLYADVGLAELGTFVNVGGGSGTLRAASEWGALRGLETFAHPAHRAAGGAGAGAGARAGATAGPPESPLFTSNSDFASSL